MKAYLLAILILLLAGCTQKPTTTTTSTITATVPTTIVETTLISECVLSLCDCKCHLVGTSPEEATGKLCGINCREHFNVTGCELVDEGCVEVYAKAPNLILPEDMEFNLTVSKRGFDPDMIVVNKWDRIRFNIISDDETRGFAIDEFYISEKVYPHRFETITFVANKSGNITYYCPVPCGRNFRLIKGTLVVNE